MLIHPGFALTSYIVAGEHLACKVTQPFPKGSQIPTRRLTVALATW